MLRGQCALGVCARGGASMRFHPKSRASIDNRPGPSMVSAQPIVAARRRPFRSSPVLRISESATTATTAPATGVHNPAMRSRAARARNPETTMCNGRRSTAPGQRARVRRRRRLIASAIRRSLAHRRRMWNIGGAICPLRRVFVIAVRREAPVRAVDVTLSGLELDDASSEADDRCVRPVVGVQLGQNALDPPLDRVLGNAELIRDLLVRVAGGDETQYNDFCRGQSLIAHMLGDLERDLWTIDSAFQHGWRGSSAAGRNGGCS